MVAMQNIPKQAHLNMGLLFYVNILAVNAMEKANLNVMSAGVKVK